MEQSTIPHRGRFLMPGEQAEDFPLVLDRCSGPIIRDRFASTGGDPMLSSSIKTSVVLIAAMALLAGCVSSGGSRDSDGPRDASGERTQLTEWQDAPITDILINLADLGDISGRHAEDQASEQLITAAACSSW